MKIGLFCIVLGMAVITCCSCGENKPGTRTGAVSGAAVSGGAVSGSGATEAEDHGQVDSTMSSGSAGSDAAAGAEDWQGKKKWKDREGIVWDVKNGVEEERDGVAYHAYLSEDGKYSWIHRAEPCVGEIVDTVAFPEKVHGAELVKIGRRVKGDSYWDIFGNLLEPYHGLDRWPDDARGAGWEADKRGIRRIVCPASVREITGGAFCGFRDLESIVLPEKLKHIPDYLLYNCISLKKIVLPLEPDFAKAGWEYMAECNHISEAVLPEGDSSCCVENGMLLSKDKTVLYQVLVPEKTVRIPEGVKEIATHAVNTRCFTQIQSVEISSTVRKLDREALYDVPDYDDRESMIRKIVVDKKNPFLAESGGCVYEKKSGTLVAVVCADGTVKVPGEVRKLGDAYSKAGKPIEQLIVPDSLKIGEEQWLFCEMDVKSSKKGEKGYIQLKRKD